MLMMCIRGKTHPMHTGLESGKVYEVAIVRLCGCNTATAHAEGSVFKRRVTVRCLVCRKIVDRPAKYVPWGPDRFVPWTGPKVELAEVQRLYRPSRRKEKATT